MQPFYMWCHCLHLVSYIYDAHKKSKLLSVLRSNSTRQSSMTSPPSLPSPDTDSTWCGKRWESTKSKHVTRTYFQVLVLDLDETLIHSHHDGVVRPTVKPGTPPDFILKVKRNSDLLFHTSCHWLILNKLAHIATPEIESLQQWFTGDDRSAPSQVFCSQAASCWFLPLCGKKSELLGLLEL